MFSPSAPGSPADFSGASVRAAVLPAGDAFGAVARMAARLFPDCVPLLFRGGPESLLHSWTDGEEAWCRVADPSLVELCGAAAESCEPVVVARLPRTAWSPRGGSVGLAAAPMGHGESLGALALLADTDRCWTSCELQWVADLAAAAGAERRRELSVRQATRLRDDLALSESRFHRLLSTYPSAIFALGPDGRILDPNPATAEIAGRPLEELQGAALESLVAPEDLEEVRAAFARAMAGGNRRNEMELRIARPSGERRLVHVVCMASEENGQVVWLQGMGRDITEERARETQLRRAERMATVAPLLSGVCHELNNPLTSIKSFAELLLLDDRSDEDREALEIVRREAHRAAKIVSDLRVVARQSQEAVTGRALVRLDEVVRHVLELRGESLAAHGIQVVADLESDLLPVLGVRAHLEQVVGQLIANSEQAMLQQPDARRLVLRVYRGDLGSALQVTDSGPGIDPEHLDRIFDPFWTTRRAGAGTGLGLSLVSSIITEHGGRVWVDSAPGRGATFTVDLPVAEAPPMVLGGAENGPAKRGLRILVVDDEAPIRFSLARYMERRGHSVEEAEEGGAALALLEASTGGRGYDIIVADLRMPGINGEQFLARLRERRDGLDSRLIFITGDAESPDVEEVLRDAGVPVVWKPFELAEVAQIIEAQAGMILA